MFRIHLILYLLFLTLPCWSQPVNFESVVVQQPVVRESQTGFAILPRLTIRGKSGQKYTLNAYLYDQNQKPVLASTADFRAPNGQIGVAKSFQGSEYTLYEAVEAPANAFFIPYDQLPLGPGTHFLQVQLQLFESDTNRLLQTSNFATFTYEKKAD